MKCIQSDTRIDELSLCTLVASLFEDSYLVTNLLHVIDRKRIIKVTDYKIYTEYGLKSTRVDLVLEFNDTAVYFEAKIDTVAAHVQLKKYEQSAKHINVLCYQLVPYESQVQILKYTNPTLNIISVEFLLEQVDNSNSVGKYIKTILARHSGPDYEKWLLNHKNYEAFHNKFSAESNSHKPTDCRVEFKTSITN